VTLAPVAVTVHEIACTGRDGGRISIRVSASTGFYVRALARDLGEVLGCGAHLAALRRTRSGAFEVGGALPLADAERLGPDVISHLVPPADALPELPAVEVADFGLRRAVHGNALGPEHLVRPVGDFNFRGRVRVIAPDGRLVALADARGGALHPVVVLG
jgi:tRNA pseudouridine55 synthase